MLLIVVEILPLGPHVKTEYMTKPLYLARNLNLFMTNLGKMPSE